jgi:hypothetical protein
VANLYEKPEERSKSTSIIQYFKNTFNNVLTFDVEGTISCLHKLIPLRHTKSHDTCK